MLSFPKPLVNKEAAKAYYEKDEISNELGTWYGKGAAVLGLAEVAYKEDFFNLIDGRDRDGNELVKAGREGKHRVGMDFTFSATKSVSVMALADERIKGAQERAVARALDHMEREYAKTRDQSKGQKKVVDTGNFVVYRVNHMTSREYDPQLHTHCLVMNMTQKADGTWRTLHFDEFYHERFTNALGMFYRAAMMEELKGLGYKIEITDRSKGLYEIQGVPKDLLEEFSKRSKQVNDMIAHLKRTGFRGDEGQLIEAAVSLSRKEKVEGLTAEMCHKDWLSTIAAKGYSLMGIKAAAEREADASKATPVTHLPKSKYDCVRDAAAAVTATEAVFGIEQVLEAAQYLGMSRCSGEEIFKAITELTAAEPKLLSKEKDKVLVKLGRNAYTTREMLKIERQVMERVKLGKSAVGTIRQADVNAYIGRYNAEKKAAGKDELARGQAEAINLVCANRDRVTLIQGDAGTGKTTMAFAVREIYEKAGWQVLGMAPLGQASKELEREAKIKASTIDKFFAIKKDHIQKGKTLWLVDEAGMMGSKNLNSVLELADQYDAKVVLIGDRKQFQSIAAGRMFALLQDSCHVQVAKMTEVFRQKTDYMIEAVRLVSGAGQLAKKGFEGLSDRLGIPITNVSQLGSKFVANIMGGKWNSVAKNPLQKALMASLLGMEADELKKEDLEKAEKLLEKEIRNRADINRAFKILDRNARITIEQDRDIRQRMVANEYLNSEKETGKKTLIITALNKDRKELNLMIRESLIEEGKLEKGFSFTVMSSAGLNAIKLRSADAFRTQDSVAGAGAHTIVLLDAIKGINGQVVYGGAKGDVVARDVYKNTITIAFEDRKTKVTNVEIDVAKNADMLTVFQTEERHLAQGERIVFLKNDDKLGVKNGNVGTIIKLDKHGNCTVRLDAKDPKEAVTVKFNLAGLDHKGGLAYNYVDYGMVVTDYKSQGQTVDKLIWYADTIAQNTFNSFYVALTRARENISIFTDNLADLIRQVKVEQEKSSTQDHYKGRLPDRSKKDRAGEDISHDDMEKDKGVGSPSQGRNAELL